MQIFMMSFYSVRGPCQEGTPASPVFIQLLIRATHPSKFESISASVSRRTSHPWRRKNISFALSFARARGPEWAFKLSHSIAIFPCLQKTAKSRR